jgi:hypothetical protein
MTGFHSREFFVVVAMLASGVAPSAQEWTTWQDLAVLDGGAIVLQWRVSDPGRGALESSNARAQWRVRNDTDSTLFGVGLDDKTYICSNRGRVGRSGEMVAGSIRPGGVEGTLLDHIGKDRCPGIVSVEFDDASEAVTFSLERNGRRQGWGQYGTVRAR